MRLTQGALVAALQSNVLEIRFFRRREKAGWPKWRRILCTNDRMILNSPPGMMALHFRPPRHPPPYPTRHWSAYNLVCTWDLFWQDYRMIPVESHDVITVIPTQQDPNSFWNYFNKYLENMSSAAKMEFMRK